MKITRQIRALTAFTLAAAALLSAFSTSAFAEDINYSAVVDQHFDGYTDNIYDSLPWYQSEASAVVTTHGELVAYLLKYYDSDTAKAYNKKYSKEFFDSNVLLLNSFFQSYGNVPHLAVNNVSEDGSRCTVNADHLSYGGEQQKDSALFVQIAIPKDSWRDYTVIWEIGEREGELPQPQDPEEPKQPDDSDDDEPSSKKLIPVNNILQAPELPTGCESVSLTILLNHLGYGADKMDIVRNYLPKLDFYWEDGALHGADFRTTFAGNPEDEDAYGCYAPCIVTTANKYLKSVGSDDRAVDISGTEFDKLLKDYIAKDVPVLIWITGWDLAEPRLTTVWITPEGEQLQWLGNEHCVVLTGYDLDEGLIYVSDPMVGNTSYDYDKISLRYDQMGKQAVYIYQKPEPEPEPEPEPDPEPEPEPEPDPKREPDPEPEPDPTPAESGDTPFETEDFARPETFDEPVKGDVDGDMAITSADALSILRMSVGFGAVTEENLPFADITLDGEITSADALEVLRYSAGMRASKAIGTPVFTQKD